MRLLFASVELAFGRAATDKVLAFYLVETVAAAAHNMTASFDRFVTRAARRVARASRPNLMAEVAASHLTRAAGRRLSGDSSAAINVCASSAKNRRFFFQRVAARQVRVLTRTAAAAADQSNCAGRPTGRCKLRAARLAAANSPRSSGR